MPRELAHAIRQLRGQLHDASAQRFNAGVTLFIRRAEPGLAEQRAPGLAAAAKP